MALSVVSTSLAPRPESKATWSLSGHDAEVISCCAMKNTFSTCGVDGTILIWRVGADNVESVCAMHTTGPACLDVAFVDAAKLAGAQGDSCVILWDVERGEKLTCFSRLKSTGRNSWPVINAVTAVDNSLLCYGGDDGYLVWCDPKAPTVMSTTNLKAPVTAIAAGEQSVYVGDAVGSVQWFDVRMTGRPVSHLKYCSSVVTGLAVGSRGDRLVIYSMEGSVVLMDVQPFALSDDARLLASTIVAQGGHRALLKCDWSDSCDAIVLPNETGVVSCLRPLHLSAGPFRQLGGSGHEGVVNFAAFVDNSYVLYGGDGCLFLQEF